MCLINAGSLILDRVYKEECAVVDVGAISDEDLGLHIPGEDDLDWPEMEALMQRKQLLKNAPPPPATTSSTGAKRRASGAGLTQAPRSPKRQATEEDLLAASQSSMPGSSRPKRVIKTAEASAAVPRKAQSIPLDAEGRPVLPVTCGIVTVHELGHVVVDRQAYHNKRYVWPVGFKSSRQYQSAQDPEATVTYYSEVKDGGAAPIFEVWAEDAPSERFQSSTSTGAWTAVFKAAAAVRGKDMTNSASGPDFFGFSNNTIQMMIETLPGVENCLNYQKKTFETGSGAMSKAPTSSAAPNESTADVDVEETGAHGDEGAADLFDLAARAMQQIQ